VSLRPEFKQKRGFYLVDYFVTTIEQQGRSRLRLSAGLLAALDWNKTTQDFDIYGFFRKPDELLCVPTEISGDESGHPFESLIRSVAQVTSPGRVSRLRQIPSAADLLLPTRLTQYKASWNQNRDQLNLNLGEEVLRALGRTEDSVTVHAVAYGAILILMSPSAYITARSYDREITER
jgi:hypothetical protein